MSHTRPDPARATALRVSSRSIVGAARPPAAGRPAGRAPGPAVGMLVCLLWALLAAARTGAQERPPMLISEADSTRAVAVESVTFAREPFAPSSPIQWGPDARTRVMLFALNLSLRPGEGPSAVTAEAEDGARRRYALEVEYVGPVPGQEWMSAVVVRLGGGLGDVGDVLVRVTHRGQASNRVRFAVGHFGGGPPEDAGSAPTPAPPYVISGRVTADGAALPGVAVTLGGDASARAVTGADGGYSVTAPSPGHYALSVSKEFYDFDTPARTFTNLSRGRDGVDFAATRQKRDVQVRVQDDGGRPLPGVEVTITSSDGLTFRRALTDDSGSHTFTALPSGFAYALTPSDNNVFTFTPQAIAPLSGASATTLTFGGARRTYNVSGRVTCEGVGLGGATVELGGSGRTAVTDASGKYSFAHVPAGFSYTAAAADTSIFTFTPRSTGPLAGDLTLDLSGSRRRYTVGGRVTAGGSALPGVTVTLSGPTAVTSTTDAAGNYSFTAAAGGDYAVAVARAHYTFSPAGRTLNGLASNQTADFSGTPVSYRIAGRVTAGGAGLSGVALSLSGSQAAQATSAPDGSFSFSVPAGGSYTVTPSRPNYAFTPAAVPFNNLSANAAADFAAARLSYKISGRVTTAGGAALPGVAVSLSGSSAGAATTDASGLYSFNVAAEGDYAVAPSHANYTFAPTSRAFNDLPANQTADFAATPRTYTVSGRVLSINNTGMSGVTVTLSGSRAATATTDSNGAYAFAGLPFGGTYTVTPALAHHDMTPASRTLANLSSSQAADFAASLKKYRITGRVTRGGTGLSGVAVALSGTQSGTATTDAAGSYSFVVTARGNYAVTPALAHHAFAPSARAFDDLPADQAADFTAALVTYTISGRVAAQNGTPLAGATLTLSGSQAGTTTADAAGSYSFDVTAAGDYAVTPSLQNYAFTPAAVPFKHLSANSTADFTGAHLGHKITGRVTDAGGAGLGGVTVALKEAGRVISTDADGNYSFAGLEAGSVHTVEASHADYLFEPRSASVSLDADRSVNFRGALSVTVRGRVADGEGRGVFGITVALAGPQSRKATTAADGSYSFLLTAAGEYTLTPSKEQGYYAFSPSARSLTTRAGGARVADFTAALDASASPSHVLEFDGTPKTVDYSVPIGSGKNIDYNTFWREGVDLGHFFWEFWAMPSGTTGPLYLISDGYGGGHAILFGFGNFNVSEPGRFRLAGNVWDTQRINFFFSDEGPAPGEWGHFAVGWDGRHIITYFNGVPVGRTAFAGPRRTPGGLRGGGRLLIGGSDHNNLNGRIAQVRGYEGRNPRAAAGRSAFDSFAPQTVFAVDGEMLSYFFRPADLIADLSRGHNNRTHPGLVRSTANGVLYPCDGCPLPQFVVDPTAPNFSDPDAAGQPAAPVESPAAAPAGALVFDSFARPNSTYILGGRGGLGSTEGGSAGPREWLTDAAPDGPRPFGILNGRAVILADRPAVAWVPSAAASANLEVRVARRPGEQGAGHNTGISFRVADAGNYFFAYTSDAGEGPSPAQTVSVGYYQNGQRSDLAAGVPMPSGWTTLRVVTTAAGALLVYADEALVYSAVSAVHSAAGGAGLYNHSAGMGLTNRWDNFAVFEAARP